MLHTNRSIWLSSYFCLHYVLWIVEVVLRRKKDLGMQRMLAEPDLGSGCSPAASLPAMPWCYALLCPAAPSPPCPDCQCMHQDSQKAPGRGIP